MINQATESPNIEKMQKPSEGGNEYIPFSPDNLTEEDTTSEMKEAEKALEKAYEHDSTKNTTKENSGEKREEQKTTIDTTIDNLNRPEAAAGLKNAYDTTKNMIDNSDTDKNPIARGLGKLIKRLNP